MTFITKNVWTCSKRKALCAICHNQDGAISVSLESSPDPHNTPDMSVTPDDPLVSMMTRPISVLKLVPDHLQDCDGDLSMGRYSFN